jgi:hypothetical protein
VWPKLTRNFLTKFGVAGVLMKAIKSCKFQLDRDAALEVQGVTKKSYCTFSSSNFHSKNDFFQIPFAVQVLVDPK